MKRIIIKINPKTLEKTYDLEGFSGTGCTDITAALTRGEEVKSQELKAEYHNPEVLPVWEQSE